MVDAWRPHSVERPATPPGRPRWLAAVAVPVLFAAAGVVGGVIWEAAWTPPTGVAFNGQWVLDGQGMTAEFSGTGLYVLIASGLGLLLGCLVMLVFDGDEVVTLVLVVIGSAMAAWVMKEVGQALGPPDPHVVARGARELQPVPGDLRVAGAVAYLALPFGALTAAVVVLFALTGRDAPPPDTEHPARARLSGRWVPWRRR